MYTITADELETMVKAREILEKYRHPGKTWVMAFLHNAVVGQEPTAAELFAADKSLRSE